MGKEEFLEVLEKCKEKDITIKVEGDISQQITMQKYFCELKEDRLYIRNSINLDFMIINLNTIRNIEKEVNSIILYIDNKNDSKVTISVI